MAKLEQREIVHSNVIDSACPKNLWHAKTRDFRIRDSTGRFRALTSRRSSIPSSHPILKGHRSASVVLMDTYGQFRFKWGQDTECLLFAVKPYRNEAKLRRCWLVSIDGHDLLNMLRQLQNDTAGPWGTCQVLGKNQRVRMLGAERALTGLQSSPVERLCIFQQAHGLEANCQIVDW